MPYPLDLKMTKDFGFRNWSDKQEQANGAQSLPTWDQVQSFFRELSGSRPAY